MAPEPVHRSTSASRYDYLKQHVIGEPAQTGRFENSVAYGDIFLPTWKDFSPRTSVVYDLFGNGKTAIRAGFNKYMTGATTGFAQIYNPTALTTQSLRVDRHEPATTSRRASAAASTRRPAAKSTSQRCRPTSASARCRPSTRIWSGRIS